MFQLTDPQTFWINTTNLALGLVTLCCAALIASVAVNELIDRFIARLAASTPDADHALHLPGIGMTMADGGEKLDDDHDAAGPDYYGF
jgi:hypothetical protein